MMVLGIQVLGPGSILVDFGHLERTAIILEYATMNLWSGRIDLESKTLHLLQHVHEWDHFS
jgi:hypothetical protein